MDGFDAEIDATGKIPRQQREKPMPNNIITSALEPIVKCHRQQRLRKKLTLLWTVLGALGLSYGWAKYQWGWDHGSAVPVFLGTWLVATLVVWIGHRRNQPSMRSIARKIEEDHPKLEAALLTALDQEPDSQSGEYHILQTRVIREALENNLKEPWEQPFHIQLFMSGVLRFASLIIVALAAYWMTQPGKAPRSSATGSTFKGELAVEPGHLELERGDAVVVTARFGRKVPTNVQLVMMP
ncbi:MAG: hypothetical protein MI810_19050, partial [Flavobacteriales bacterium]|nr:hypothetical protein [Flavobacteriales bacterium]